MSGPVSMGREDVAKWLGRVFIATRGETRSSKQATLAQADAVLTLVEKAAREAVELAQRQELTESNYEDAPDFTHTPESIVSRVMGRA